ncbi:hypothetical protein CEUSTIGMA_g11997.t1 [Chlamydomonas eustigma]|uniref:tRNA (guanine-N(7)-)-methyltransferase non-catalytic subunit n=1 Tax=Chlamydomonas eustigma TaxID=1157962 RepID=A0A250XNI3_9CHLO|nr:hypothetical protein CEUSTIGMA_g11997.t1 [Chlamydomonas eustigma]|eukprot:GAX84576.1 hypothetical protein CEUSTIGMA_g11997.t1 [Chlamydomonas eustigma]
MGRRRRTKRHDKFMPLEGRSHHHEPDSLVRLIVSHPTLPNLIAVAIGPTVRISDCSAQTGEVTYLPKVGSSDNSATASVRILQFSLEGTLLLTGSDDRMIALWDTITWKCLANWLSPKKASAGTFTRDSKYILWGDKFGDILIGDCASRNDLTQPQHPALLFGHLCSVVSSISVSPDNRFVITCDKDRKVRVSILPERPLLGCVEIQTYCLGHTYFVSSCAWVSAEEAGGMARLVTGSGDGTVRLWDVETGKLLDTCVVSEPEAEEPSLEPSEVVSNLSGDKMVEEQGGKPQDEDIEEDKGEGVQDEADGRSDAEKPENDEEEDVEEEEEDRVAIGPKCPPVTCVASSRDGCTIATLVEGEDEVLIIKLNTSASFLTIAQRLKYPGVRFPSHALFDCQDRLWVVGGPPLDTSKSAHIGVAAASAGGQSFVSCTSEVVPPSAAAALEQRQENEEKQLEAGALVPAYTKQLMIYRKRWFTPELHDLAKKSRRDYRESERLRKLVEAGAKES